MSIGFHDLKMSPKGAKFMAELNWLANRTIHVGFQRGKGVYENGADVADVAMYNEFGTSKIPPRPFMEQSFKRHEVEYVEECENIFNAMIKGQKTDSLIRKFGAKVKQDIVDEIELGQFVPNAPSTVAKKGFNKPLYETGLMEKSISYYTEKVK
ncbi:MAG: hypothetical protein E7576_07865 [Ruminococcaceae bacterium]|jgi:hypothetical protein|nr:hypothetical protein [Oscillospiraceae bacterium]